MPAPRGRSPSSRPRTRSTATSPRSGPRLTHRAVVLVLVLLVLVVSYASSLRAWLDQRQQIAETQAEITQTRREVADLEQEKRRWADDSYVEQQARARLAYVLPGETGYRVITEDGETVGGATEPGTGAEAPERAWYVTLWQTTRRAGREQ